MAEISLRTGSGRWILTACTLVSGLGFLESSAVNIALPTIQEQFRADISAIQWIADAYLLSLSSLILLSGTIADRFGRRRVFAAGIVIFAVGTLTDGLAPDPAALIGFRALQGIGAALMIPGSLAVINTYFPDDERGRAVGLWAGISGAVAALGPFIGGFLVGISWRLLFFAIVPLGVASWYVVIRFVPADEAIVASAGAEDREHSPRRLQSLRRLRSRLPHLDWPSAGLIVAGLGLLSYGLIRLPDRGATAAALTTTAIGAVSVVAFFVRQRSIANPLVPLKLFSPTVLGANLATLSLYFALQGGIFLLSFDLQQLLGLSPTMAGLALLPTTVLIASLSGPSGSITDRFGPRPQMIVGPLLVAAGFALFLFAGVDSGYAPLFPIGLSLVGVGMATIIPAITTAALEVGRDQSGTASGVNNAAARVAGLLAIVVVGGVLAAVFSARVRAGIAGTGIGAGARAQILDATSRLLAMKLPPGLTADQKASVTMLLRSSYVIAFRAAIAVNVLLTLAAAVISAVLVGRKKTRGN